jgi:predicted aspartyl protease
MERIIALVLLLAAGAPAYAQERVADPPVAPAEELAFADRDTRMTVPVSVAGAGPYAFVVDTGAQRSVISRQLANTLGLPAGRRIRLIAISGADEVDTVVVPSLSVGPLGGIGIEAPALDENDLGARGILGIDSLQGHRLAIDFDHARMTVVPSTSRDVRPREDADTIVVRARSMFGQLVVSDARLGGRRVRVILDTGASLSMGNMALRRLARKGRDTAPAVVTSVLGTSMSMEIAVIGTLELGRATFSGLSVAFSDAAPFRAFALQDKPALLLGMDALKLFRRVDIDFANRELRLEMPRGG